MVRDDCSTKNEAQVAKLLFDAVCGYLPTVSTMGRRVPRRREGVRAGEATGMQDGCGAHVDTANSEINNLLSANPPLTEPRPMRSKQ